MIVSYKWLQTYFKDALPVPSKVAEAFTFGAFEVEGMEELNGDTAIDLKVLPDRACYALSHRGVANELSAILGQKINNVETAKETETFSEKVSVTVANKVLCPRYCARYIKNIKVETSPAWLKEPLEAVGQRSINTIVDATNFVTLDMGQPLHAFDADKIKGGIVVRLAKAGEVVELLPEKGGTISRNITLTENDLIIADDDGPVAIAGVKGGMRAAVTEATTNLIIESANFDAVSVRKTSTRLALRNDASKRFENNLSVDFAPQAMEEVSSIIKKLCPTASIGEVTDKLSVPIGEDSKTVIEVSSDFILARLGANLSATEMEEIFSRLRITFEKKGSVYTLNIPTDRLDLNIPEDIVEEIGRIYGYDKIAPVIPQKVSTEIPVNNFAYWTEKIKDVLFGLGFSEVQTSSFSDQGEIEIQNPLASDKSFARHHLHDGFVDSLERNSKNAALLGTDEVKTFEVGTVFEKEGEHVSLVLGVCVTKNMKKKDQFMADILSKAFEAISTAIGKKVEVPKLNSTEVVSASCAVAKINLSEFVSTLSAPTTWDIKSFSGDIKYVPFSIYPFMVRDVAVFVPSTVSEKEVSDVIDSTVGPLMIRRDLFDVFTKKFESGEEKTSYAFHIVFQSHECTLVEEEVNTIMKNVSDALTAKSWQVR
jgi:phenylalanyl-tRNA synthetase beta chain